MEIRVMEQEEQKYSYQQSMQIQGQTGSIGYLRGDFGRTGTEWFSTWFDFWERWKTDEFKAEFDEVINALRSDEYGLLKDRSEMQHYAEQFPDSAFMGNYKKEYGFRVDTGKHTYLIRCNPTKSDYEFYCYCYVTKWLDQHIKNARQGIRFIQPDYTELFRLPDGGKIIITTSRGEKQERICRYIDEYHAEIGSCLYHICQFAERMRDSGATYEEKQEEQKKVQKNRDKER